MEKIKQWAKEKGFEKWFQRDNFIVLILAGILLFIIALPVEGDTKAEVKAQNQIGSLLSDSQKHEMETEKSNQVTTTSGYKEDEADYVSGLEERLKKVLSGMSGVGKVEVMITLQSSEELIVEKDEPIIRSDVIETDSEGGSRNTSQLETRETTIYKTVGSDSEPYVVKRILPKVEGVLVVAQGAGSGTVNKSITEIVQALFDVEVHKVKVVKMEESK